MTIYETPAFVAPSRLGRLSTSAPGFIRARLARAAKALRLKRDIADVNAMDDHMLRDIGLNRADISFAVRTGRLPDR